MIQPHPKPAAAILVAESETVPPPARPAVFPIVGIGASAGGLDAFMQLLRALPEQASMAFVLIQHLDPTHPSRLVELLSKATRMQVFEATHGMAVQPGCVYVIAPNTTLSLAAEGLLWVEPRREGHGLHLPIDHFFKSLAEQRQAAAIGVVLSGAGSDGTLGLEEIKSAGGITFAQDEASAKYNSMPLSALRSGCVDRALPPDRIATELTHIARHPYVERTLGDEPHGATMADVADDANFKLVLALLRSSSGVDFSAYRETTIHRRINRRMLLHGGASLAQYVERLRADRNELDKLYQDILINVTSFFREPEVFEALKVHAFPEILAANRPGTSIRIWVPGCSTGQEAYSLAIALLEFLEDKPLRPQVQIFGTDLSETVSLHKARAGLYPESITAEVSPERLRRFFQQESDGSYRVGKALREIVVFARQNVSADPPFSRIDLVSCRNLLIYLSPPLQKRVIPTFHYALNPGGFLLLGSSENIGQHATLFEVVDQSHRIFVRKSAAAQIYRHFRPEDQPWRMDGSGNPASVARPSSADWQREADRIAASQFVPPGVLINDDFEILQFRGQTGPFLSPAAGEPNHNLLKMAREGLFLAVRSAVTDCQQSAEAVRVGNVRVRGEDIDREIALHVIPVKFPHDGLRCYLVLFEELARRPSPSPLDFNGEPHEPDDAELKRLHQELASTREYLQSVIEQQEDANEELKSASEEILSSNEELQSTNEELETAKEELQSVNEELTTINEQLENRNDELVRLNDDMTNLVASGEVGKIVLGLDLRVRRFTPAAGKLLELKLDDIGRPIGHVKHGLEVPELERLIFGVIAGGPRSTHEVRGPDGRWWQLRVLPYRTANNRIDGAVLELFDIDDLRTAQKTAQETLDYAQAIVETVREPLLVLDARLRVQSANAAFYATFEVQQEATVGRPLFELGNRQWDIPALRRQLVEVLSQSTSFANFELRHDFESIGLKVMRLNARRILRDGVQTELILLAIEDYTDFARLENELGAVQKAVREALDYAQAIVETVREPLLVLDAELRVQSANAAFYATFKVAPAETVGRPLFELGNRQWDIPALRRQLVEVLAQNTSFADFELRHDFESIGTKVMRLNARRILRAGERTELILLAIEDHTDLARLENEVGLHVTQLVEANRHKTAFLALLAHELRNPLAPIRNALQILEPIGSQNATVKHMHAMIERQLQHMLRLVDDLLDVARISSGRIEVRKQRIELRPVLEGAVEAVRPTCESIGVELISKLSKEPLLLDADATRLVQVIGNLLNNACKFNNSGGKIALSLERDEEQAVIRVQDSGIGMAADELPRIFDMFVQLDDSLERSRGGLGIGLTLVKQLVKAHGGTVSARSDGKGQGSVFEVRLPLADATQRVEAPTESVSESKPIATRRRVLVVDDNRDSVESLAMILEIVGHDVQTAHEGHTALALAASWRPEAVLLDIGLPGMNGYDVARRIREQAWGERMLLVALTGWGQSEDRRRSSEAGFDAHLVKPADPAMIMALLASPRPMA